LGPLLHFGETTREFYREFRENDLEVPDHCEVEIIKAILEAVQAQREARPWLA
jgi:hypothetical protein